MRPKTLQALVRALSSMAARTQSESVSDGELLERYVRSHDETAFELVVWRHACMVLGQCRRYLPEHDAEDAFWAVFLVLARKAGFLCKRRESIGGWLWKVTGRAVGRVRKQLATRRNREGSENDFSQTPDPNACAIDSVSDLWPVVRAEIDRLPASYRQPLLMRFLNGMKRRDIAAQLAIPADSVSNHVTLALKQLRRRLAKRGIALSCSALVGMICADAARSQVPPVLVASVVKSAAAVSAGQTLSNLVSPTVLAAAEALAAGSARIKAAALAFCLLLVAGGGLGGTLWAQQRSASTQDRGPAAVQPVADHRALALQAAKIEKEQRLLTECVPRIIAALERIAGKAQLKEAVIRGDEVHVSLAWQVLFVRDQTVSFRYNLRTDKFALWRDEGEGKFRDVDPAQPVYLQLWRDGPRIVYGVAEVNEMRKAFELLR